MHMQSKRCSAAEHAFAKMAHYLETQPSLVESFGFKFSVDFSGYVHMYGKSWPTGSGWTWSSKRNFFFSNSSWLSFFAGLNQYGILDNVPELAWTRPILGFKTMSEVSILIDLNI